MSVKLINSIHNCHMLYRKAELPLDDLTGRNHTLIFTVCEFPGRSQDAIAKELHLDKSTVARVLSKLEANGYVVRTVNEKDNRQLVVCPTKKALDVFPQVKNVAKKWARLLHDNISADEMKIFNSVLKRMHENATNAIKSIE